MHVWLLFWTVFWLTTVFISSSKHFDVLIFVVVRWRNSAPTFLPASRNFILNSSVSASQALS